MNSLESCVNMPICRIEWFHSLTVFLIVVNSRPCDRSKVIRAQCRFSMLIHLWERRYLENDEADQVARGLDAVRSVALLHGPPS